jgi:hypothetical protein
VQLPELGWPAVSTAYYRATDVLAIGEHEDARAYVFVGARRPEALRDIDERLRTSPEWDHASWGPGLDQPRRVCSRHRW